MESLNLHLNNGRPSGEGDGQRKVPRIVVTTTPRSPTSSFGPFAVSSRPNQSPSSHSLDIKPSEGLPIADCNLVSFSWKGIDVWTKVKEEKANDVIDISDGDTIFHAESIPVTNYLEMAQPHISADAQVENTESLSRVESTSNESSAVKTLEQRQREDLATRTNKFRTIVGMKRKITKHILKNVSGYAKQGELVAMLGASGAGKTTLLNVLTGRSSSKVEVNGEVCINGASTGVKEIRSISAYIQQGDILPGALTVLEHLTFCAFMRLGNNYSKKERATRINQVIEEFGLVKCLHTRIGIPERIKGISGGEKRRLAVASELLWNPDLVFCDEPLSGLDSFTAEDLMFVMKRLTTKLHKTIICTIHQPSSHIFQMFDRVILLSEGRTAFLGSLSNANQFFAQLGYPCPPMSNPSDHFIESLMITPDKLNDGSRAKTKWICDAFEKSTFHDEIMEFLAAPPIENEVYEARLRAAKTLPKYRVGWWSQFASLLYRNALILVNDRVVLFNKLILSVGLAFVIGLTLFDVRVTTEIEDVLIPNIGSAIFMMMVKMSIQNIFGVLNTLHEEFPLLIREHHNHMYRTSVYFLSKQLTDIPVLVFFPALFYVTSYLLIRLTWNEKDFLWTGGVLLIVSQSAAGFGYFISCVTNSINMALSIGPGLLMPLALFCGFFIPKSNMALWSRAVAYASWFHWGNEALMPIQLKNVTRVVGTFCVNNVCPTGTDIMEQRFEFYEHNFWLDLGMLAGIAIGLRILAFFSILWKTRE